MAEPFGKDLTLFKTADSVTVTGGGGKLDQRRWERSGLGVLKQHLLQNLRGGCSQAVRGKNLDDFTILAILNS